jgi:hypothetical protein
MAREKRVVNRIAVHRETARRTYESQKHGYQVGYIDVWYTPDGEIDEPYELTLFSPKRGEWTVRMTSRDSMDPNPEFEMYWTRIPDLGIKEYDVFPHEDGSPGWSSAVRRSMAPP